jgi:glutamyl-tRNA synthetase
MLWAGEGILSPVPAQQQADFIDTIQPNVLFPEEVAQWVSCLFSDTFALSQEALGTLQEIMHKDYVAAARDYMAIHPLDYGALTAHLKTTLGLKGKALFMPLRLLLTGESRGPELGRVLSLLGKAEVERRLSRVSI